MKKRNLLADEDRIQQNINRLNSFREEAQEITNIIFSGADSAVINLSNAVRGNSGVPDDEINIEKIHGAILDESILRFKESVERFSSKKKINVCRKNG